MEVPIIINHQIKSKKVKRKMESNIAKILFKKVVEKMCDSTLLVLTFTDDPPL